MNRNNLKGEKGCFAEGCLIQLPENNQRKIELLEIGDVVLSFNSSGELEETKILEIRKHENEKYREYTLWNKKVAVTDNHWILNQFNTFVEIQTLTKEDAGVDINSHLVPLCSVSEIKYGNVYSVITENGTVIVNKIRFHNGGLGLEPHITGRKGKEKGSGGEQRSPVEDPNTLRSKSILRIVDLVSEGPIQGLVDGLKSVYLDETPVQNSNLSYNFRGLNLDPRLGYPDQDPIPGLSRTEQEVLVGVEIKAGLPIVRTINDNNADAVFVKITIPNLSSIDLDTGDTKGTSVQIKIELKQDGGVFETKVIDTISGKTTSSYERSYRIELPNGGNPYEIRVSRLTADSVLQTLQNKTFFSSYTKVVDIKMMYPDSAVMGLTVDSEQFGSSLPNRAYEIYGMLIKIPSNYNPTTREYTGIWDGTFDFEYSNNPAWVFYDLITNERYGLGEEIKGYFVDKWTIYEIGKYCDELVPDGFGGFEPRYTMNVCLTTQQEAYRVLNSMASAFTGMLYWGAGVITASQDSPKDPVRLVTPANVIKGLINYSGTSLKARHTVAVVSWNDPDDNYRLAVEVVEDADAINRYGYKPTDVVAFGCTSRGQAQRFGKWVLDTEKYSTETASYQAGLDHADIRPGQIIAIADPAYAGARLGGRIKTATTTVIEIDKIATEEVGVKQSLWAVLPNGEIEQKDILMVDGNIVTLSEALSEVPQNGSMFIITAANVEPRQFRVISVTENEEGNLYDITSLLHDPGKYDRIEKNIVVDNSDFTILPSGQLPPPSEISTLEFLYLAGVTAKSAVTVSWRIPPDPRAKYFELQVLKPGYPDYENVGITQVSSLNLQDTISGEYTFRVRSISALSTKSDWIYKTFKLDGLLAPPADVEELRVAVNSSQLYLEWDRVPDLDLDKYEIKYSPASTGVTWGSSQLLATVRGENITIPARNGTYLIKAIDTSGVYSINPAISVVGVADILSKNVVELIQEQSDFPGVKVDVESTEGVLYLTSSSSIGDWPSLGEILILGYGLTGVVSTGEYYAAESIDLGEVYTVSITSDIIAYGESYENAIGTWDILGDVLSLGGSVVSDLWSVELELRQSNDGISWGDWKRFYVGEYTARAFEFRLIMTSFDTKVTPAISKLGITVDMPDRVHSGQDLVCPPAGLRVNYTPSFAAKPAIATNSQGLTGGEYCVISNSDETGFDIIFYSNDTNTAVGRTFDYVAHGYGRKVT